MLKCKSAIVKKLSTKQDDKDDGNPKDGQDGNDAALLGNFLMQS